jgi:alkylhydroperoxidase family enzyme
MTVALVLALMILGIMEASMTRRPSIPMTRKSGVTTVVGSCLDMHTRDLIKRGMRIEKLALVQAWAEAGHLFSERERAALAWAEAVTRVSETGVPDEAFQAARAVFEEKELVDLTIAISVMNAYNRLAIGFRNPPRAALEN